MSGVITFLSEPNTSVRSKVLVSLLIYRVVKLSPGRNNDSPCLSSRVEDNLSTSWNAEGVNPSIVDGVCVVSFFCYG